MDEPDDDIFSALDRAVRSGPAKGSLAREIKQNFAGYQKRFDGHQNDWKVIAEVFGARGFRDKRGNPASAVTARKIYERVRREQQAASGALPVAPSPRPKTEPQPRVAGATPTADDDNSFVEPSSRFGKVPVKSRFTPKQDT